MAKDIHKQPFDEGTKAKLSIFRDYLREWLPVFISSNQIYWHTINIYDFFAGPGSDIKGEKGTPLIILEELEPHYDEIAKKKIKINLYFNEFDHLKYQELVAKLGSVELDAKLVAVRHKSLDFKVAFEEEKLLMKNPDAANLLFLDQNGLKHITADIFQQISKLKRTDFLFFISSSLLRRFDEHPSITQRIF